MDFAAYFIAFFADSFHPTFVKDFKMFDPNFLSPLNFAPFFIHDIPFVSPKDTTEITRDIAFPINHAAISKVPVTIPLMPSMQS